MRWDNKIARVVRIAWVHATMSTNRMVAGARESRELWELSTQQVENLLKHTGAASVDLAKQAPPEYLHRETVPWYRPVVAKQWWRAFRRVSVAEKFLDRELTYRANAEYRGFVRSILDNPFDTTARLVFADWCEERGHMVLSRRLRRQARDIEGYLNRKAEKNARRRNRE